MTKRSNRATLLASVFVICAFTTSMVGLSSASPSQYRYYYVNENPGYYTEIIDGQPLLVTFDFNVTRVLATGYDFKYCGINMGTGPYAIDVDFYSYDVLWTNHIRNLPYAPYPTGSWYNTTFQGEYPVSSMFSTRFYGLNSGNDYPALLVDDDVVEHHSSYYTASGWVYESGEYLVKLRYQNIKYMDELASKTGTINATNIVDAYWFYMGNDEDDPYCFTLNRTGGSGNLNMRVVDIWDDTFSEYYDTTQGYTIATTSGSMFPKFINSTFHKFADYMLLVEPATPGVDIANYSISYVRNPPGIPQELQSTKHFTITPNDHISWLTSEGATSFNIYRETSPITTTQGLTPIANVVKSPTLEYNATLPSNVYGTYYFAVTGKSYLNESLPSANVHVHYSPLWAPPDLAFFPDPSFGDMIVLTWSAVTGATTYNVYRETSSIGHSDVLTPLAIGINETYYVDTLPAPNTYYYYAVQAVNASGSGFRSTSDATRYINTPPVLNSIASPSVTGQISLSWNNMSAEGYYVYRSTSIITNVSTLTPLAYTTSISYSDNLTSVGYGTYYYVIEAYDGFYYSGISNCENVTYVYWCPYPPAPQLQPITPNPTLSEYISLEWNNVPTAEWYLVYRSSSFITDVTGLPPVQVVSTNSTTNDLFSWGTYYYVVKAANSTGFGPISNCVNVTYTYLIPPSAPFLILWSSNPTSSGVVDLSWSSEVGAINYKVYRDTTNITSTAGMDPIATTSSSTYSGLLTDVGTYYYVVVAENAAGDSPVSNNISVQYQRSSPPAVSGPTPIILACVTGLSVVLVVVRFKRRLHWLVSH